MTDLLHHCWYVAAPAAALQPGAMLPVTLLGQQALLLRTKEGEVSALRDFCPHRGIPLRYGKFDGCEVECCYHGWRFNAGGGCTAIPSLTPEDNVDISRVRAGSFPACEQNGLIWVYMPPAGEKARDALPLIPDLPLPEEGTFRLVDSVVFPCDVDHAVIGLMDPSHGPFVHRSWWWRSTKSIHLKQKRFEPVGQGFRMSRHKPSSNSRAYKALLGGEVSTEITFQLPSLRYEHIEVGKRRIVLLTALTPRAAGETALHQFIYTDVTLLNTLLPILKPFGKSFIQQDLQIVKKQQEGLQGQHPSLMLLGDADQQALWYYRLKKEFLEAQANGRVFENKLKEKTLRWRS